MGLRSALKLDAAMSAARALPAAPGRFGPAGGGLLPVGSPWANADVLTEITMADVFGVLDAELFPITRREALSVPAVAAARHRIVGTLGRLPIRAYASDDPEDETRYPGTLNLITQPDPSEPQFQTILKTLEDLLFDGRACWAVTASGWAAEDQAARPTAVTYVPLTCVQTDQDSGAGTLDSDYLRRLALGRRDVLADPGYGDGRPWLVWFTGPHPGLLSFGSRTIRSSVRMDRAASRAADNPVPSIELHQTNDAAMTDLDIQNMLRQWMTARRGENGGVGYTSSGVEARALGQQPEQLLIEGRNQQAVEVARLTGIPAASIDAALPSTALTYANLQDRLQDLVGFGLQPYGVALTSRLSMPDLTPRTAFIRFDYSSLYPKTNAAAAASAPPTPEGTP
jgi:portal protein